MAKKKPTTTDAVEIIARRYFAGRKDLDERYEQEAANLEVAWKLYEPAASAPVESDVSPLPASDPTPEQVPLVKNV